MVRLPYKISEEWNKKGREHLLGAFAALGMNVFTLLGFDDMGGLPWFIIGVTLFIVILESARAVHYFKRPERDYLIFEDEMLLIDRGMVLPRKKVLLENVKDREYHEEELILKRENNEEDVAIENNALEEKDLIYVYHKLNDYVEESV